MNESKHTPGPWRIDTEFSCHDPEKNYYSIVAGQGCYGLNGEGGFNITAFITPDDANVICAAPEMLEALEKAADEIIFILTESGFRDPERYKNQSDDWKMIKSAISKAKGL